MSGTQHYKPEKPFALESGEEISALNIAYHSYGTLNRDRSNVIWVFHALTANSDVMSWWPGLFGSKDYYNPEEYFIVCANCIGSPYGSTAPEDLDFPSFTVRDVAKAHLLLAKHLGISQINTVIGGSFGGSQALEFALAFKGEIGRLVLIACSAKESAWGIAVHEAQRLALKADATFGQKDGGKAGLKAARAIGILTYRTQEAFTETQADNDDRISDFRAASYIDYQGEKLVARFTALSYYYLNSCLDTHNVGRGRGGLNKALSKITCPTLVIGISSDQLLPCYLQKEIAKGIVGSGYVEIDSAFGHDGFLIETEKITAAIKAFEKRS